jgi:uncharacterized heparinase superfamily protein
MGQLARYFHTVRHLRPVQVYGRARLHLVRARVDARRAPPRRVATVGAWVMPPGRDPRLVGPTQFRFLGVTRDLAAHGWDDPAIEKLWRYNLHYFEDLASDGAEARAAWHRALVTRWVRENTAGVGTGWEPYPTSQRIVNWIKWALAGNALPPECLESLAVQSRWLAQRLEIHLLGNHLLANAKALVFAGLFFEGDEPRHWLERGLRILEQQLPEQVLADGGHFERSTMYHALALEDVLDLCNVARSFAPALPAQRRAFVAAWRDRVARMWAWLRAMSHPDGDIAFFNDAALGTAPSPAHLARYAEALGVAPPPAPGAVCDLAASGYVRLQRGPAVAFLDVAPVGPDYLPGHAHADTLSFELSLGRERFIVNSGTSQYGEGAERLRQRGTGAHSTVQLGGADSSEVWAGFRVARRARPFGLSMRETGRALEVSCSHDGYRRLRSAPVHTRRWRLSPDALHVTDTVTGSARPAVARFFLHPEVDAEQTAKGLRLRSAGGATVEVTWSGGDARLAASTFHPRFGEAFPNSCIEITLSARELDTVFRWSLTQSAR